MADQLVRGGERVTLPAAPVITPPEASLEVPRIRHRLLADPQWTLCALVLLAFDAATLLALGRSVWLVVMVLVVSAAIGSYRRRHSLTISEGDGRYLILTTALVVPMLALDELPIHVVLFTAAVLAGLLFSRVVGFFVVHQLRRRRPRPVFVAGAGHVARMLARAMEEHPEYGLRPAAFVSDVAIRDAGRPVYPYDRALPELQAIGGLGLVCAFGPEPQLELHRLIRAAELDRRRVWAVPRMFDLSPGRDHIWGIAIAPVHRPPLYNPLVRVGKRIVDEAVAVLALVLLSPLMLAIAVLVRVTSRGPILFRQTRVGLRGREFSMLKFRTMRVDRADAGWTVRDDPRRTPAGRLLRRTSLDELPQLVNVVRGDMSLIGPRPEQRLFAEHFARELPTYPERTRAPAGITGLAQVHDLRGDTPIEDRVRFDNRYIDQYSLFLDLVIAVKTVGSLFRSKHSY